jgi:surface antigen
MRAPVLRRHGKSLAAGLGLAAIVAASACTPLTTASNSGRSTGSKPATVQHAPTPTKSAPTTPAPAKSASTTPPPATQSPTQDPYATRVATPHAVTNAPALNAYPWATDETEQPDAYGFTRRQCVSYAAWYLNVHGTPFGYNTQGPKGTTVFGDASGWDAAAQRAGFTVSTTPVVGSIAQWHAYEYSSWVQGDYYYTFAAGSAGHVGVVTKVYADGSVDVAQYNTDNARSFSVSHLSAPRYIYVPLANPHVS